ncbi:MAG: hypothetical protein ACRD2L_00690 [Terriglobia bacterium]
MNLLLRSRRFGTEEILEVREVLEVRIAGLAAERAQLVDIEAMQARIDALTNMPLCVIPAKAGIQPPVGRHWIPAFAGMTGVPSMTACCPPLVLACPG